MDTKKILIEPELLEIFSTEAYQHLDTIDEELRASAHAAKLRVSNEFLRAIHTLHGSAKIVKIKSITAICSPLEDWASLQIRHKCSIPLDVVLFLQEVAYAIRSSIDILVENQELTAIDEIMVKKIKALSREK